MEWKSATKKEDDTVSIPDRWLHLHYYEALNILFRMENALRVFVYIILKNEHKDKWTEVSLQVNEGEQSTIRATAAQRIAKAKGFGYLGYGINSPLMYLNSGELTHLIISDTYWKLFKPYFKGKKEVIQTKLEEIGIIRNSLAHFRPIKIDDIELIKQNVKHAFVGIEECFAEMTNTSAIVPTNTTEEWYKSLIVLGTDLCKVHLFQSKREEWIRVQLTYSCPILNKRAASKDFASYNILNLLSPAIVRQFPKVANYCIYVTESVPYPSMGKDLTPNFRKEASIIFSRAILKKEYALVVTELMELLLKIQSESELVQQDNLARGILIESARAYAFLRNEENHNWWDFNMASLKCPSEENDPAEYWGDIVLYNDDFIAGSNKYPWMPSDISKEEFPF
jgi:hypothetical protein